ncbi:tyrosine-type recombinase/integrase [Sulfurovum sp. XGS-02]|uniref:tyrosine-type recombinase/integrase n=1 Tax=Sulfurovum sp. XGS-02 TaxID=2925411 RepID=UPI00204F89CD|nr:tyrosine-type recombinase/integrase [Sulfurovum sp. XGS-02]UPT77479.1 tyrosine-type recombinase/integrase [Sulfurovum sp. XGS-02]
MTKPNGPEQCQTKRWIKSRFDTPKELSKDLKIGELIAYIFARGDISCAKISRKGNLLETITYIADITLKDFNSKDLFFAASKACEGTDEKRKKSREQSIRSGIKTLFLDPAIKKNLLTYAYLRRDRDDIEDFLAWISRKSSRNPALVLTGETTLEEYLGWLIKNKKLSINKVQSIALFKEIIEKLIKTKIKDINSEMILDALSTDKEVPADKFGSTRSNFKKVIMKDAIDLGICKFARPRSATPDFRNWIAQQTEEVPKISRDMTFGQFVVWLNGKNKLNEELLFRLSKTYAKKIISDTFDIKLSEFRWKDIQVATETYKKETGTKAIYKNLFKRAFLDPAAEMGLLVKEYTNRSDTKYMIACQLELSEHIKKEDRTIGFYIAKIYGDSMHQQTSFLDVFLDLWDTKASCLVPTIIPALSSRKEEQALRAICDSITEDKLLQFDFYDYQEMQRNMTTANIRDDIWKIKTGVSTYSRLDFRDIESKALKILAKKYIKWRIGKQYKGQTRTLRQLKEGLFFFLSSTDRTLTQFTNRSKKEWLLWLKGRFSDSRGKQVFYTGKQFLSYCLDIHPKSLSKNLNLSGLNNPFKESAANPKQYPQWEIDQIISGLKRHNDRQFSDILTLIMLTAKRRSEILTLKRDCLIDIAGIKYLKYTDSKNNAEKRSPLQSFRIEGAPSLFKKDVETIITEIIERQITHSKDKLLFCHPDERDLLLISERAQRNNRGYKCGAVTGSVYKTKKEAFVRLHKITFSLDAHKFRHTLASAIIRSGKGIDTAARTLGNHPKTTAKYYEANVSKKETMSLPVSPKVDALEDAKELAMLNEVPTYCKGDAPNDGSAVPGGRCLGGQETKLSCKFYQRLFGSGGCLGCGSLGVGEENRFYYEDLKYELNKELDEVKGTPFASAVSSKIKLVTNTLKTLDKGEKL